MEAVVRLFMPPSMRRFSPRRVVPGARMRHVALEYDLVEALQPGLVVDLGAGDCMSFFTTCQSMVENDVDGVCYAFDTWSEPTPSPEAAFENVRDHGRSHYPGISYLVKMSPLEAERHFEDASIDLLRVDGARSDIVAALDIEQWFRRVTAGGIIVWHAANADSSPWSVVASRCATVLFSSTRGNLGLARKEGPPPRTELLRLLFAEGEGSSLARLYEHIHEHLEFGRLLSVRPGKP
jgi:hypothetical protein